jgi:hypothetical protein
LLLGDEDAGMARSPPVDQARYGQVVDFYDYAHASVPHPRRHRREEVWQPLITDDLPDRIPKVTTEEQRGVQGTSAADPAPLKICQSSAIYLEKSLSGHSAASTFSNHPSHALALS